MHVKRFADADNTYCNVTADIGTCFEFIITPCNDGHLLRADNVATVW